MLVLAGLLVLTTQEVQAELEEKTVLVDQRQAQLTEGIPRASLEELEAMAVAMGSPLIIEEVGNIQAGLSD